MKRASSPAARPTKLNIMQELVDLTDSPMDLSTLTAPSTAFLQDPNTFKPPSSGPKIRVLQTYLLEHLPRAEVSISLNGLEPEVRFVNSDTSFIVTGTELLQLATIASDWPSHMMFLDDIQIMPHTGGCRLAHHDRGFTGIDFFDLTEGAVTQLKLKMRPMVKHVHRLQASKSSIRTMFDCIVKVFKVEYQRLNVVDSIDSCGDELCRQVMCHIPPYDIVRDFCLSSAVCELNHYSLLSCALAQKDYIFQLLK